jgi:hypothetical protein
MREVTIATHGSIRKVIPIIDTAAYTSVTPLTTAEEHEISQITFIEDRGESNTFTVLIDGGAAGSTTDNRSKLHGYKLLTTHNAFHDTGKRLHISVREGYMRLACETSSEVSNNYVNIH